MGQVLKLRQKKEPRMIFGKHVIEQFKRDWHDANHNPNLSTAEACCIYCRSVKILAAIYEFGDLHWWDKRIVLLSIRNGYRKYIAMNEMTSAFMGNPYEVWEEILADEEMEAASGTA